MNISRAIDLAVQRGETIISEIERKQKLRIYAEGLKAKIGHVEFALNMASEVVQKTELVSVSESVETISKVSDELYFYTDAFWAFLYSCLDVLGQVVNQSMNLSIANEQKVDFKSIEKELCGNKYRSIPIQRKFTNCLHLNEFVELDKYRNCSTHRRRVYIERVPEGLGTPEYSDITAITRSVAVYRIPYFLCDDPYTLSPTINKRRRIPDYMRATKIKIFTHVQNIVRARDFVR